MLIFNNAGGTPRPYANPDQFYYYFAGYDAHGNLYIGGLTRRTLRSFGAAARCNENVDVEVPRRQAHFPGTVLRSGSSLLLGDQTCRKAKTSCLYEAALSGITATITKRIALTGSCDVAQIAARRSQMFGGDDRGHGTSSIDRWAFPGGGRPQACVPSAHVPIGAAVVTL